ncbi:unnamed protein product [Brugia timori]|uniref:Bm1202 n=3 Tax=Brugia TaxID=6278 RepID=A0A0J9XNS3_BRUMA|nr:Bm1202 [Brugia malayi]VDO42117.1 unnamed protein product [Brugia timori]
MNIFVNRKKININSQIIGSMKILFQFLLVFSLCLLIAALRKINMAVTFSPDNEMPANYYGATFINTDGILESCTSNADCYNMREPIFWCRLAEIQDWTDKGCYCDSVVKACIIERITKLGPITVIRNYALCTWKELWECPPFKNT